MRVARLRASWNAALCSLIQTPHGRFFNFSRFFFFHFASGCTNSCINYSCMSAVWWIKWNKSNVGENVEYKHDKVRQSLTAIHNRHRVPFVWNKPPLIVQQNKESHKLFRCSPMAAQLQPLTCIWLDVVFCRAPRWSACFKMAAKYMWPRCRPAFTLMLNLFITLRLHRVCAAKPVIINSVD